ncbi:hypothetical protein OAS39_06960 [Pirellulales bacterium]|nr:hypothetical protein [Pirellulales bacterium]
MSVNRITTQSIAFGALIVYLFLFSPSWPVAAAVYNVPPDILGDFETIGTGDTLNVFDTGVVGNMFTAGSGSTVNIYGGSIGGDFFFVDSTVNIRGGEFGLLGGASVSNIEMSGGSIDIDFSLLSSSTMNMSGGSIGEFSRMRDSTLNLTGGSLLDFFSLQAGGVLNISGGSVGHSFAAQGGVLNLSGTDFKLDGVPISGVVLGTPLTISEREVTLTAELADGAPYELNLFWKRQGDVLNHDLVHPGATITVTLVPESSTLLLAILAKVVLLQRRVRHRSNRTFR